MLKFNVVSESSNEKIRGGATLPLVLQWRGAGGTTPLSLSPPSLKQKWRNTGGEVLGRWMKATADRTMRRQCGDLIDEVGIPRSV